MSQRYEHSYRSWLAGVLLVLCCLIAVAVHPEPAYALTNPTVCGSNSSSGILIRWNTVSDARGYKIYRKAAGVTTYSLLSTVSASTRSYTDSSAAEGKTYTYRVKAYKGNSYRSGYATVTRLKSTSISETRSTVRGMELIWNKVRGAASYRVYRSTAGCRDGYKLVGSTSTQSYTDATAVDQTSYLYYVVPVKSTSVGMNAGSTQCTYRKPVIAYGDSGCLYIESAQISVPLYAGCSQEIVNRRQCAAFFEFKGCTFIADHMYQNNFTNLYEIVKGETLQILNRNGRAEDYTCVESKDGWNTASDITDESGCSITKKYPGSLIIYTCRGGISNTRGTTIHYTVWERR